MKKLVAVLLMCLSVIMVTGCAESVVYADPPATYVTGTVEFCDDWGCRYVTAPYYYVNGEVVYYDYHFGCWIGPRGYLYGGVWRPGWIPGYHGWYGAGHYHYFHSHPGGWKAGSGWHGYHGGGGHGGHR